MEDEKAISLLRRHIEAVWHLQLPPLDAADITLAPDQTLPQWRVYQAQIGPEQITLWHPATTPEQRAYLLRLAQTAVSDPATAVAMRREVIFLPPTCAQKAISPSDQTARLLTTQDASLIAAFAPGSTAALLSPQCAPCVGVIVFGRLVSVAHSSRRTAVACELGIDTLPEARRQGYALAATRRWTALVRQAGLLPIYSALADNTASLRLAASAGYTLLACGVYGPLPTGQDE